MPNTLLSPSSRRQKRDDRRGTKERKLRELLGDSTLTTIAAGITENDNCAGGCTAGDSESDGDEEDELKRGNDNLRSDIGRLSVR